jgi:hypothetical protein
MGSFDSIEVTAWYQYAHQRSAAISEAVVDAR